MTRGMRFGTYNTASNLWTLSEWHLTDAQYVANFVEVPGRMAGPLDLSAALTDGEPCFGSRTLEATFETSEGTRADRIAQIANMVNTLSGRSMRIVLPDDWNYYLEGRLHVEQLYNDLAHAAVRVTAICEPWLYRMTENYYMQTLQTTEATLTVKNEGRMTVVPRIEIEGSNASALLKFGTASWTLGAGTYYLPDLAMAPGDNEITCSGSGDMTLAIREAVLR